MLSEKSIGANDQPPPSLVTNRTQASRGRQSQRLKAFYWSRVVDLGPRSDDGGDSSVDESPQVTAGDAFNQPPNLFMGDAGFYFFEGDNITGRQETQ